MTRPKRIFLSHKGADKPLVRKYKKILATLGFDPWLDEDAMPAGTELERGILEGFHDSCAVIFFISPAFKDVGFLATEVNYAIAEKRAKGDRFAIIPLVLDGKDGRMGAVPDLLSPYTYRHPETDLDALDVILRALPIEVGSVEWKA